MEVALRLLQTLADPSAELEMAERWREAGMPDLRATLHNTVFKVCQARLLGRDGDRVAINITPSKLCPSTHSCSASPLAATHTSPSNAAAKNGAPKLPHCLMSRRDATL